ncbi:MAG: APC family permease [Planctomycetes bacterium]|nr:APC family permease [Planctomycetota bacterium]
MTSDAGSPAPVRLGAFDIGCVVVGGIVGVGIFFTPAKVAAAVDGVDQVLVAWALGGVVAIVGALVFADLARLVPGHGGTFLYLAEAFGPMPAFLYGWANWLAIQSGALGVIGWILAENLDVVLHGDPRLGAGTRLAVAVGAIAAFTLINALGLRLGKSVQNLLTLLKTFAVFSLVGLAWYAGGAQLPASAAVPAPRPWLQAVAAAMLPVLFSFGGWQQGSFVAGAARRPRRDVPLGILGGVAVVVVAYLTVNLAFLSLLGHHGAATSRTIAADAARAALAPHGHGEMAARLLAGMVSVSALGILNTICLAPPYVLHTMARRGLFLASAGELHSRFGTPVLAVLVQGGWGILLVLGAAVLARGDELGALGFLLDGVVFVDWLFFALTGAAVVVVRRRAGAGRGLWRYGSGLGVLFAAFGVAITAGAVWTAPRPSLVGLAVCGLGALAYRWFRRSREKK